MRRPRKLLRRHRHRMMTNSGSTFDTVEKLSARDYLRLYHPGIEASGGLLDRLCAEVKREHYEPIEDEL